MAALFVCIALETTPLALRDLVVPTAPELLVLVLAGLLQGAGPAALECSISATMQRSAKPKHHNIICSSMTLSNCAPLCHVGAPRATFRAGGARDRHQ